MPKECGLLPTQISDRPCRLAPHTTLCAHTHFRRIELSKPKDIKHRFSVQKRPFSGKSNGDSRLSEPGCRRVAVCVHAMSEGVERTIRPRRQPEDTF